MAQVTIVVDPELAFEAFAKLTDLGLCPVFGRRGLGGDALVVPVFYYAASLRALAGLLRM